MPLAPSPGSWSQCILPAIRFHSGRNYRSQNYRKVRGSHLPYALIHPMYPSSRALSISMSQKLTVLQTASHSSAGPGLTCPHSRVYKLGSTFPLEPADGLPCQAAKPVTLGRLTSLWGEKASCSGGAVKSLLANDPTHTEGGGTPKRGSGGRQGCGEQGRGVRVCSEGTQEG